MVAGVRDDGHGVGAVVQDAGRGTLRVLRTWLEPGVALDGGRTQPPDVVIGPPWQPLKLRLVWPADPPFDRGAAGRALHRALAAWRAAERDTLATSEGSVELARLEAEETAMRAMYQRIFAKIWTSSHLG